MCDLMLGACACWWSCGDQCGFNVIRMSSNGSSLASRLLGMMVVVQRRNSIILFPGPHSVCWACCKGTVTHETCILKQTLIPKQQHSNMSPTLQRSRSASANEDTVFVQAVAFQYQRESQRRIGTNSGEDFRKSRTRQH